MSVADDSALDKGGGTLQLWRISDLITRPEEEVLTELEPHRRVLNSPCPVQCANALLGPATSVVEDSRGNYGSQYVVPGGVMHIEGSVRGNQTFLATIGASATRGIVCHR